jgi:uncharacterized membrane protein
MTGWRSALAATLAIAALTHLVAVWAVPRVIMARTIAALDTLGAHNRPLHPPRPTDRSRGVVMPSPDLLYTACSFDLGAGPLRVSAPIPATYWSVALFADNTDNFFVLDDRAAGTPSVDILLIGPGEHVEAAAGERLVRAPSRRGIVLFRTLISRDDDLCKRRGKSSAARPSRLNPRGSASRGGARSSGRRAAGRSPARRSRAPSSASPWHAHSRAARLGAA